jgi:hypothetical protein
MTLSWIGLKPSFKDDLTALKGLSERMFPPNVRLQRPEYIFGDLSAFRSLLSVDSDFWVMSPVPLRKTRLMARKLFSERLFHLKPFCFKFFFLKASF